MNFPLLWLILCGLAYLFGSIPFGYLIGKLVHRSDIRKGGSGNIGATNALRQYGVLTGVLVLILDILKGFVVAWLLYRVVPLHFAEVIGSQPVDPFVYLLPALAVILGHMYSLFLGFKGGKGVATAGGVFLYLTPLPLLLVILCFVLISYLTRYVSVGSILSAILLVLIQFLWDWYFLQTPVFPWFTLVVALLIIYKHNQNILRLLDGTESRLGTKPKGTS